MAVLSGCCFVMEVVGIVYSSQELERCQGARTQQIKYFLTQEEETLSMDFARGPYTLR